jgi:hypothetical protein
MHHVRASTHPAKNRLLIGRETEKKETALFNQSLDHLLVGTEADV